MKKDGPYSWLVLLAIIVTNFCCMGYLVGSASIYSEVYPRLLNKDITVTNVIGSTLMGVFMFSGNNSYILSKGKLANKKFGFCGLKLVVLGFVVFLGLGFCFHFCRYPKPLVAQRLIDWLFQSKNDRYISKQVQYYSYWIVQIETIPKSL